MKPYKTAKIKAAKNNPVQQSYKFNCPQCGIACKSEKQVVEKSKRIVHNGKTYSSGLIVVTTHSEPHCSMFLALETNEFLRAHAEQRLKAEQSKLPEAERIKELS